MDSTTKVFLLMLNQKKKYKFFFNLIFDLINLKKAKYWTNPQFLVKLENNGRHKDRNESSILIALMQKDGRLKRKFNKDNEYMQFRLFKVIHLRFQ